MERDTTDDISTAELAQRVVYALLKPAVRLARVTGIPLRAATELLETAYFQEARESGATLDGAAEALGVSRRTAARLSAQLKERFLVAELRHNLPRRIEFMLSAEPLSAARIRQLLPEAGSADVDVAIAALIAEGRIEAVPGRTVAYRPTGTVRKLRRDTWVGRVGGLTSFAANLADATYGRFIRADERAFARTLSFRIPAGAEAALVALYEQTVLPAVVALGSEADAHDESAGAMMLSLCWAPYELSKSAGRGDTQEER